MTQGPAYTTLPSREPTRLRLFAKSSTSSTPSSSSPLAASASGRRGGVWGWLSLLICLIFGLAPSLSGLGEPDLVTDSEAQAMAKLDQTWRAGEALPGDYPWWKRFAPRDGGQVDYAHPPMAVWLGVAALEGLNVDEASPMEILHRSRLLSVAMGLLAVVGMFWAVYAIGGLLPATLSGMLMVTMPAWVMVGRIADPMPMLVAWTMLSVGAGLWAVRPLRPSASVIRRVMGWMLCGIFMWAAIMTGGLRALPPLVAPLLIVLLLTPGRISHVAGLIAAACIAAGGLMPWAVFVHEHDLGAWESWWAALAPAAWERPVGYGQLILYRLAWFGVMLLPWTLWVGVGLMQTFSTSSRSVRQRLLIGWTWLVSLLMMMALSPGDRLAGAMVMTLPAAAVLLGQTFRQMHDLSMGGRYTRLWRWLRWPHLGALVLLTLVLTAFFIWQRHWVEMGWPSSWVVQPMAWYYWAGMGTAMLMVLGWSVRYVKKKRPVRASLCWSAWSLLLVSFVAGPLAAGPMGHDPKLSQTSQIMSTIQGKTVVMLDLVDVNAPELAAWRFYMRRDLPPMSPVNVQTLAEMDEPMVAVLAPDLYLPIDGWRVEQTWVALSLALWVPVSP